METWCAWGEHRRAFCPPGEWVVFVARCSASGRVWEVALVGAALRLMLPGNMWLAQTSSKCGRGGWTNTKKPASVLHAAAPAVFLVNSSPRLVPLQSVEHVEWSPPAWSLGSARRPFV